MRRGGWTAGRGALLGPADLGMLAASGRTRLRVTRRPRVDVVLLSGGVSVGEYDLVPSLLRGRLEARGVTLQVRPYPDQKSGVLRSLTASNALIDLAEDVSHVPDGSTVRVLPLGPPWSVTENGRPGEGVKPEALGTGRSPSDADRTSPSSRTPPPGPGDR